MTVRCEYCGKFSKSKDVTTFYPFENIHWDCLAEHIIKVQNTMVAMCVGTSLVSAVSEACKE